MIAGSIFVFGNAGIRPGAGMRRGTIGLFGGSGVGKAGFLDELIERRTRITGDVKTF